MNFMQFCHRKGNFSTLNLRFAYFVRSEMSIKGIIMFLGVNNKRLERKILIFLDFENGFLLWMQSIKVIKFLFTYLFTTVQRTFKVWKSSRCFFKRNCILLPQTQIDSFRCKGVNIKEWTSFVILKRIGLFILITL